jgi:hypothetical protein
VFRNSERIMPILTWFGVFDRIRPVPDLGDRRIPRVTNGGHFLAQRLAHPRRGWKPEFKEGRYPPLDGASCCAWIIYCLARHHLTGLHLDLAATAEPSQSPLGPCAALRVLVPSCRSAYAQADHQRSLREYQESVTECRTQPQARPGSQASAHGRHHTSGHRLSEWRFFCTTSSSSTAGREARIQRRTLPAVGCSVLFASSLPRTESTSTTTSGGGVDLGVMVETTGEHRNKAAGRGWMMRLDRPLRFRRKVLRLWRRGFAGPCRNT